MPYDTSKTEPDCDDSFDSGFQCNAELYRHLVAGLAKAQYKLVKHPTGLFCGHHAYQLRPLQIEGVAKRTYFWQQLNNSEEEVVRFQEVAGLIDPPEGLDKFGLKSWYKLVNSFSFPSDGNTIAYKLSRSCLLYADTIRYKLSLRGESNADVFKLAPQVSWFSPELQKLDARDLLALFPDAEASTFMLVLGRALMGASGEECREGTIEHTFRSMAIVIGDEGGLGKTTLLTGIVDTMKKLGYVTDILKTQGRFGWASPVLADLAYNDDLNKKTQKQLLTEDKIKTIVTGGTITTEEKGVKDVSLKCRAALISCSNYFNKLDYLDMDGGEISRANLLYTHNKRELERLWLDRYPCGAMPAALWSHLCEQYKCTNETLYCYLLARSAELFMATIGYSTETGVAVRVAPDRTQEVIETNREQYRLDYDMTNLSDLVDNVVHSVALTLADAKPKQAAKALERLKSRATIFDPQMLRAVVNCAMAHKSEPIPTELGFDSVLATVLSPACFGHLQAAKHTMGRPGLTLAESFAETMSHLIATDGHQFPRKLGSYTSIFAKKMQHIEQLVEQYREQIDNSDTDVMESKALGGLTVDLRYLLM